MASDSVVDRVSMIRFQVHVTVFQMSVIMMRVERREIESVSTDFPKGERQ